jgi:hypothetical protein
VNVIKSYISITAGIIYLAALLFCCHSCSLQQCIGVACKHGVCIHGDCNCNSGYEGSDCGTIIRNTFLGHFDVNSSCFANESYGSTIYEVTTSDYTEVEIDNISNIKALSVVAEIEGTQGLIINPQVETYSGLTWIISGTGVMTPDKTTITFVMQYVNVTLHNATSTCTEVYTRITP